MRKDVLIRMRIMSKEWQIKQCDKIIKDIDADLEEIAVEIDLIDDDMSDKGAVAHHSLYALLKKIGNQEASRFSLNQELLKLNNQLDDLTGWAK